MEEYLKFAKDLAYEAGEIALKYFSFEVESTWKDDGSPLTIADTEINDLVIRRINEEYPSHSILGEESSDKKDDSQYMWVCDPIDGTVGFSRGMPLFVFSIALIDQVNGQPMLGIAYDPIMKNMYYASKGSGAYRNDQKIFVSNTRDLKNEYINTASTGKDIGFSSLLFLKSLDEKKGKYTKLPSFIYGAVQVASGKYVGGVYYGKSAHDVAALKIIIMEAGGRVTDLNGDERRYDQEGLGIVVSNGVLHDELLECVRASKL